MDNNSYHTFFLHIRLANNKWFWDSLQDRHENFEINLNNLAIYTHFLQNYQFNKVNLLKFSLVGVLIFECRKHFK